jgi:hypothetical protein
MFNDKMNLIPDTVAPEPQEQYNVEEVKAQLCFVSDGSLMGQSTLFVNGKPLPGIRRLDFDFSTGKGCLAIEQYISWLVPVAGLVTALAKQHIEVVFLPSESLRGSELKQ